MRLKSTLLNAMFLKVKFLTRKIGLTCKFTVWMCLRSQQKAPTSISESHLVVRNGRIWIQSSRRPLTILTTLWPPNYIHLKNCMHIALSYTVASVALLSTEQAHKCLDPKCFFIYFFYFYRLLGFQTNKL